MKPSCGTEITLHDREGRAAKIRRKNAGTSISQKKTLVESLNHKFYPA